MKKRGGGVCRMTAICKGQRSPGGDKKGTGNAL